MRSLLAKQPDNTEIALILNPRMNAGDFVRKLCEELGIHLPPAGGENEIIDILNRHLLKAHAAGKRVVLIVDEAQNLTPELLEQVRLLTNLETETQKLLQIILIGQPELRDMLARNDLRQLAQRITGRYHLDPLSREESAAYVKHRLRIAGATVDIFTRGALAELYRVSGGVPRLLNIIGDRALLGGYSADQHEITAALVRKAAGEVSGRRITPAWLPWALGSGTAVVVAGAALLAWSLHVAPPIAATVPQAKPAAVTPAATEPAPATPEPDLATILHNSASATDLDGAYTRLFALWSAHYVAGSEDACSQARSQNLECLNEEGGIASLRRFNRPAILPLEDHTGAVHQVIVSALTAELAQVQIGDAMHDIPLLQLQELWRGDFTLLWKPPQDSRNLALGSRGEPVRALRQRLRQLADLPPDTAATDVFDESLQSLVVQFQRRNGIATDGVAGTQTLALLDATLPSTGTPQLGAAAH